MKAQFTPNEIQQKLDKIKVLLNTVDHDSAHGKALLKDLRMLQNRLAAYRSRHKKIKDLGELEARVAFLEKENAKLRAKLAQKDVFATIPSGNIVCAQWRADAAAMWSNPGSP
jgi:hypothetical protein